ncbi:MAG: peptidogalycan biosysnthesis protein [Flavobacteriales bacterium]
MQFIPYPEFKTFDETQILFGSGFLESYFNSFKAFESKGILKLEEHWLVPYQVLHIDLGKAFKTNTLFQGNNKWYYQLLMQCGKSESDSLIFKVLVLGNILITGPDGFVHSDNIQIDFRKTVKDLFKKFPDVDTILFKDSSVRQVKASKNDIWVKMLPLMQVCLKPEWSNFDDYLNALSSKYRIRVKSAINRLGDMEFKDLDSESINLHQTKIHQLYMNVFHNAGLKIAHPDAHFLFCLKERMGKQLIIKAIFHEQEPVAFSALLHEGENAYALMVGLDYTLNESHKLYFNLLIDLIQSSIQIQARNLNMGRTAMEIKSTLGAEPIETFSLVKFKSIANQLMFKQLVNKFKQPEWIQRRPFKVQTIAHAETVSL